VLGWQEIILILAILLLIIGPSKLPEIAKELGKAVREFRKASEGISETVTTPGIIEQKDDERKAIVNIATKLGVLTEGKTTEQITKEITTKIEKSEERITKTNQNEVK